MRYMIALIKPPDDVPIFVHDEDDNIVLYNTEEEAEAAVKNIAVAQAWGYEIIEWL